MNPDFCGFRMNPDFVAFVKCHGNGAIFFRSLPVTSLVKKYVTAMLIRSIQTISIIGKLRICGYIYWYILWGIFYNWKYFLYLPLHWVESLSAHFLECMNVMDAWSWGCSAPSSSRLGCPSTLSTPLPASLSGAKDNSAATRWLTLIKLEFNAWLFGMWRYPNVTLGVGMSFYSCVINNLSPLS